MNMTYKKNIITLKKNKDFQKAYSSGKSSVSKNIVIYKVKNNLDYNRFGITASKKIGNAVKRNRARRIIKLAYRENQYLFEKGYDFVFVARVMATKSKLKHIVNDMIYTVKKLK